MGWSEQRSVLIVGWRGLMHDGDGACSPAPTLSGRGGATRALDAASPAGDASGRELRPRTQTRDLIAAASVMVAGSLPVFLVGTLAVELRGTMHFSPAGLGIAVGAYYLAAATASIPLAMVADRIGATRLIRAATSVSVVLLMMLATVVGSWPVLIAVLVASGMVSAGIASSTNQFLARRLRFDNHGLAIGIKQAAVPFASLLGGLTVPTVALTIGWRWAFALAALLSVGAHLLMPPPRAQRARGAGAQHAPVRAVRVKPLVMLAIGLGLGVFAATGLTAFLVTAGVTLGLSQASVGLTATLAGAAAVAARVGLGYVADRWQRSSFAIVAIMLVGGAGGYALIALATASQIKWLFVTGAVIALGIGWGWNGLFNFAVVRTHMHAPARATAITQVGGRLGGVLGPITMGVLAVHASYTAAWLIVGCAGVAGALAIVLGRRQLTALG